MIVINHRHDTIVIPLTDRKHFVQNQKNYLLVQNTYTKDIYILKVYSPFDETPYLYKVQLSLPEHFTPGEYQYYLTPDDLLKVILDVNNINNTENEVFKNNKLNFVFSKNGVIFADTGDNLIANTQCEGDIFKDMRIISGGILKFNENPTYNERTKQTQSEYIERR